MVAGESDVGLSFRNTMHRLKRFKLKKLDFLVALQLGELKAFIRLDSRHRFDIPALFWENFDTAYFRFSSDEPDFHLSLFDLRDAAIHDIERLRTAVEHGSKITPKDLPFLGKWYSEFIADRQPSTPNTDAVKIAAILLSEYFRRGADPIDALISQLSLEKFEQKHKPKSNAGRLAVPGPDSMWEAVIVLVASSKKPPTIEESYRTMDSALSDKDRTRKDENGNLIYTDELLNTRAKQIRKTLTAVMRNSDISTN